MEVHKLSDMFRGWFVGDFEPAALKTEAFEVAVKYYRAGEKEERHYHKIATELTVVVSGQVLIAGRRFEAGEIVVTRPGEALTFEAITDTALTIVKVPSVKGDKYSA